MKGEGEKGEGSGSYMNLKELDSVIPTFIYRVNKQQIIFIRTTVKSEENMRRRGKNGVWN